MTRRLRTGRPAEGTGYRFQGLPYGEQQGHGDQNQGDHADPAAERGMFAIEACAASLGRPGIRHELLVGPVGSDIVASPDPEGRSLYLDSAAFEQKQDRQARSHGIDAEEFYRMLGGVVIDDTGVFNDKLREGEDYYNYHRPTRRPGRPDTLLALQAEDPDPDVNRPRQTHT